MVMNRYVALGLGLTLGALALGLSAADGAATITTFDVPGAGTGPSQGTLAYSINQAGVIAGSYVDARNQLHAFLRAADGTFTTFDARGTSGTAALSINAGGATTGAWASASGVNYGFARSSAGVITLFGVTGAGTAAGQGTLGLSINQGGAIAGQWIDANGVTHGFVRSPKGAITTFDVPGATNGTEVTSINKAGAITGGWFGPPDAGFSQGFVRASDGAFTTFDIPGAASTLGSAINAAGTIAGFFLTISPAGLQGFVRASDGTTTTFGKIGSEPYSINAAGAIAGTLTGAGFLRTPGGTIVDFQVPDGTGAAQATSAYCINSSGAVTGWYVDANNAYHGFLRTP